ncbi:MAG: hypothetical protein Q9227_002391 [Pyrenula ochraceoflavens]
MSSLLAVLALAFMGEVASAVSLTSTGATLELNQIPYYIPSFSVGELPFSLPSSNFANASGFVPITVVDSSVQFSQLVSNFSSTDDVFNPGFLQVVYSPDCSTVDGSSLNQSMPVTCVSGNSPISVPQGPYFWGLTTQTLHQAYRLYPDFAGAFTETLIRMPTGDYATLSAAIDGSASLTVGVPSRLYYTPTAQQPLAGVRIGVKDIYDVAGVRTSDGNRAYYNLYPPRSVSAVAIQRLEAAGAIIVGKQKSSQFANGEEATADWVDYHSPFNPRGDG